MRATVDLEDINIEKLDLVEADEPRIIYEEYDPWFYFIIFEVDFYSKKVPNELIGTLRTEARYMIRLIFVLKLIMRGKLAHTMIMMYIGQNTLKKISGIPQYR